MSIHRYLRWISLAFGCFLVAACSPASLAHSSTGQSRVSSSAVCIGDVWPDRIDLFVPGKGIETVAARLPVPLNSALFAAASHEAAGPTNTGLCVASYTTRDPVCFDRIAAEDYAISADGKWLAYSGVDRAAGGKGLFVLEIAGGRRTRLSGSGRKPAWSPDATQIVYEDESSIRVVARTGGNARTLAAGTDPSWSPADGVIVYRSASETFERMSSDGQHKGKVIDARGVLGPLQWSPDGRSLLGVRLGWDDPASRPCQHDQTTLFVISAADGVRTTSYPYCGPGAWRYTWIPVPDICSSERVR